MEGGREGGRKGGRGGGREEGSEFTSTEIWGHSDKLTEAHMKELFSQIKIEVWEG